MVEPFQPAQFDWHVRGGDCLTMRPRFSDSSKMLYDLTGYQARIFLRWKNQSLTLSSEDSPARVVLGGTAGTVTVEITGSETDDLPTGRMTQFEFVLTQPDGCESTPLIGYIVRH